jgi:hypothetical protein
MMVEQEVKRAPINEIISEFTKLIKNGDIESVRLIGL